MTMMIWDKWIKRCVTVCSSHMRVITLWDCMQLFYKY